MMKQKARKFIRDRNAMYKFGTVSGKFTFNK